MKILFIASSGGHWEELMCLQEIIEVEDSILITETGGQSKDCKYDNVITVPQINRHEKYFIWHFLKLFIYAIKIVCRNKPKLVISTGALISYPFCLITKISGGKIIYIESFARVKNASLTGKLIYPISDLFLVQWEELLEVYPKAKYVGSIF